MSYPCRTAGAERANAHHRVGQHDLALQDCAKATYARSDCKRAWLVRRLALHALGRHQEAVDDMERLMREWGQQDAGIRHAHERATFELRKSKRPDLYALLGVSRVASEGEVKAGYRAQALVWHPDKAEVGSKAAAEERFKLLGEALKILGNPMRRQLWDEGYDAAAIEERIAAADRAARNPHKHQH